MRIISRAWQYFLAMASRNTTLEYLGHDPSGGRNHIYARRYDKEVISRRARRHSRTGRRK